LTQILVDADGCPVKEEVYRVAKRHGLRVVLVANAWMRTRTAEWLELVVVDDGFDAADDWIVEHCGATDIVITGDIPLASRCLDRGARVLGHKGRDFDDNSIGDALAGREIQSHLRQLGVTSGGGAPFAAGDRSSFLRRLDEIVLLRLREK